MQRAHPPREISPPEFFLRWIPEAVARDESRKARLRDTAATIEFTLRGAEGGVFTLRVEGGEVQGCHGEAASADLRVELDVGVWPS